IAVFLFAGCRVCCTDSYHFLLLLKAEVLHLLYNLFAVATCFTTFRPRRKVIDLISTQRVILN
ncbi:hypothetical protein, partial [Escherichia coli]|uniref:hypothetical protein n=1 Tax=Escherichia coli TaxID=562 RepID=UPI001BC836A4